MTTAFDTLQARLKQQPRTWVVTGVAGFIGSNLLESLLALGQRVVGLDNYATGHCRNLELVRAAVGPEAWGRFHMIEGDICDANACRTACEGADYVLHQAALGSVPRSIEEPAATNAANVDGFLNMLVAAREAKARRFVYASSSSLYGDHPGLPKVEDQIGEPLSPYAVTKLVNELYASVFGRCYGTQTVGLRYFNIFGPRQDPEGAYAAVIPQWVAGFLRGEPVYINGDGETSRDFCYVANAVQANLLAATADADRAANQTYNIAVHERTTLNRLFTMIRDELAHYHPEVSGAQPVYRDFRAGDVRHSLADISKAQQGLGYAPTHLLADGLNAAMRWYVDDFAGKHAG